MRVLFLMIAIPVILGLAIKEWLSNNFRIASEMLGSVRKNHSWGGEDGDILDSHRDYFRRNSNSRLGDSDWSDKNKNQINILLKGDLWTHTFMSLGRLFFSAWRRASSFRTWFLVASTKASSKKGCPERNIDSRQPEVILLLPVLNIHISLLAQRNIKKKVRAICSSSIHSFAHILFAKLLRP